MSTNRNRTGIPIEAGVGRCTGLYSLPWSSLGGTDCIRSLRRPALSVRGWPGERRSGDDGHLGPPSPDISLSVPDTVAPPIGGARTVRKTLRVRTRA